MARSKTSPRSVAALEKRTEALKLRKEGYTYSEIAERMGVSQARAWQLVQAAYREAKGLMQEEARQQLEITAQRLEALLQTHWPAASAGNDKAGEMVLKIIDRQARFFGWEAPRRINLGHGGLDSLTDQEVLERARAVGLPVEQILGRPVDQGGPLQDAPSGPGDGG